MNINKGEEKAQRTGKSFAASAQITRSRLTKIPDRISGIDAYPSVLKKGTIPLLEANIESVFKKFISENKKLFEVESKDLQLVSAKNINRKWFVKYGQTYKGIPVYNAVVSLETAEDGKVSSFASNYLPGIKITTDPKVDLKKAVDIAKKTYPKGDSQKLSESESILLIFPVTAEGTISTSSGLEISARKRADRPRD